MTLRLLALLIVVLLPCRVLGTELKLATWNLDWLTTSDRDLPADVRPKRPEDIDLLRQYAAELAADVIAVQEVDGPTVAARIPPISPHALRCMLRLSRRSSH